MRAWLGAWVLVVGCGGAVAATAATTEPAPVPAAPPEDETETVAEVEPTETDEDRTERERREAEPDARAEALFRAAEATREAASDCDGIVTTLELPRSELARCIRRAAARANELRDAYDRVLSEGSPRWSIAALVRQAEAYDELLGLVLTEALPEDLQRSLNRASPESRAEIMARFRARLDDETRLVECLGVARYVLALRAATVGEIESSFVDDATRRIAEVDDATITSCVEIMRRGDPAHGIAPDTSFAPWDPHERRERPASAP